MGKLRFTFNVKLFLGVALGGALIKNKLGDRVLVIYFGFFRIEVKFFKA